MEPILHRRMDTIITRSKWYWEVFSAKAKRFLNHLKLPFSLFQFITMNVLLAKHHKVRYQAKSTANQKGPTASRKHQTKSKSLVKEMHKEIHFFVLSLSNFIS